MRDTKLYGLIADDIVDPTISSLAQDAEKCSGSCDSCGLAKDKMQ